MGKKNLERFFKSNFGQKESAIEKELTIEREAVIDGLIDDLAKKEGMDPNDEVLPDIIVFAPYKGNESVNLEYIKEVAKRIGISMEEMTLYAIEKAKDFLEK